MRWFAPLLALTLPGVAVAGSPTPYAPAAPEGAPSSPARGGKKKPAGAPATRAPGELPDGIQRIELSDPAWGGTREAFVVVPPGATGPMPVVLGFHGGHHNDGMDMAPRMRGAYGHGAILVFPSGKDTPPYDIGWVGPGLDAHADPERDVKFVRGLIDELDRRYGVDRERIYAAGFSNGAYFTQVLYCGASDLVKGFLVVSRAFPEPLVGRCEAAVPRKVMLMIGTADDGIANGHSLSMPDTLATWQRKLQCDPTATREQTLPDQGDATTVRHTVWTSCAPGAAFEYYEIEGGGHAWPGGGRPQPDKSRDVDATAEMLRFFDL